MTEDERTVAMVLHWMKRHSVRTCRRWVAEVQAEVARETWDGEDYYDIFLNGRKPLPRKRKELAGEMATVCGYNRGYLEDWMERLEDERR